MDLIPFVGGSYNLDTRQSGVQRTINMVPVPEEPGNERTAWVFKDAPGLEVWSLDPALVPDEVGFNGVRVGVSGTFLKTAPVLTGAGFAYAVPTGPLPIV